MLADLLGVLTFSAGYNTAVVMAGATILGIGAGVIGTFSLLRRQALISDAISHATLPGIALGFLLALALTGDGRNIAVLTLGAALSGGFGILVVQWITHNTRLTEDAAIGTVLSVFFGGGVVLMSYIQTLPSGGQAGLNAFLLGSTATMIASEATVIAVSAAVVTLLAVVFMKEFGAACFDPEHATTLGYSIRTLDLLMTGLLLAVVAVGLKTVGLILIIALVIIPPVTARFWTDRLGRMTALAGLFGGLACFIGSAASAVLPSLPTGSLIVMVAGAGFAVSLCFAPRRGVLGHLYRARSFRGRVTTRQALISLSRGAEPDPSGRRALARAGLTDADGSLNQAGRAALIDARDDWAVWNQYLKDYPDQALGTMEWGSRPIGDVLPADLVEELRSRAGVATEGRAP